MMNNISLGSKKLLEINFGQRVLSGRGRPRDYNSPENPSNRWVFFACIVVGFLLFLGGRLFDLQIIEGNYYRSLAEGNRIRRIPIKAARGEILDRNGVALARNIPVYKLATFSWGGVVEKNEEVSRDDALKIQTEGTEEENRLLIDSGREYPFKEVAAHVVGYVNEAASNEVLGMSNVQCPMTNGKFELGDLVGRMGIEEQYDCLLRGINGEELIEVDAKGRLVRRLGRKEPISGKTLKLSLDINLQTTSYESLQNAPNEKGTHPKSQDGEIVRGALIARNPRNGEILALVSEPSFDPNMLKEKYAEYAKDINLPFFNRAIGGVYHPGSTFKIITAAGALEDGKIDGNYTYQDVGFVEAGGIKFRNWLYGRNGGTEGIINVTRAITRSTDTFFYIVGDLVGIDRLAYWANQFGLGQKTQIDLPGEAKGLMPTPDWKIKTKGERWYLGNTYNTAIGQGDVAATPIQISGVSSAIASGGKLCIPHLLLKDPQCSDLNLKQDTLQSVKQGMLGACSPGGTAGQFFNFEPQVACKTGTAEVGNNNTHAWFTAFSGPFEAGALLGTKGDIIPQLDITVVIEEGGEGSVVAAPVVKKVYEKYFGKN